VDHFFKNIFKNEFEVLIKVSLLNVRGGESRIWVMENGMIFFCVTRFPLQCLLSLDACD